MWELQTLPGTSNSSALIDDDDGATAMLRHVSALVNEGRRTDAIIDRTIATFSRALGDHLGCSRPHYLHDKSKSFLQAWPPAARKFAWRNVREPLPHLSRSCGEAAGEIARTCDESWRTEPDSGNRQAICAGLLVTNIDLSFVSRLLRSRDAVQPESESTTTVFLPEALTSDALAVFLRLLTRWNHEERVLGSGRRQRMPLGYILKALKRLVWCVQLPDMTASCVLNWLVNNFDECGMLRAGL